MFKYILTLSLALLAASCGKKENAEVIKIATSGDNPPYEYYQDGKLTGFDIDLGHAIAKQLGKRAEFVDVPFDSLIASLQSHKVDMAIASLDATPERQKSVDFSIPYHQKDFVLVIPGITDIKTVKDLAGKKIGAQHGSTFEIYAKGPLRAEVDTHVETLTKLTDLIQNLRTGRIDGIVVGIAEADRIQELHSSFKTMKLPGGDGKESVALPKNSPLTQAVDEAITALQQDGTLDNLKVKWGLQ